MRRDRRAVAFGITKLLVGAALSNHLKPQLPEDVCYLRWLENRSCPQCLSLNGDLLQTYEIAF